jgi:hypothetical protein
LLSDEADPVIRKLILEANQLLQSGNSESGLAIIQALLDKSAIAFQYSTTSDAIK